LLANSALPNACMDQICPAGCGAHGQCIEGNCVCQQGWQGPNCKDPKCPDDCGGHGQCSFQSVNSPGQCVCNYGWGGAACQRVAVYAQLQKCPNDCSGNGLCMDGMCTCNVGFKAADCSEKVCSGMMTGPNCDQPRCPNDCSGRGLCMTGVCACWSSYSGRACNMPIACKETCVDVCNSAGQETKCNQCIGMCESSAPRSRTLLGGSQLGIHNPFEDMQTTLLQSNARQTQMGSQSGVLRKKLQSHLDKKSSANRSGNAQTHAQHLESSNRLRKLKSASHSNASGGIPHVAAHHNAHNHKEVSATRIISLKSAF
jgi:hypothetical protein